MFITSYKKTTNEKVEKAVSLLPKKGTRTKRLCKKTAASGVDMG